MFHLTWGCIYLFKLVFLFSLNEDLGMELLAIMVVLFLNFWGISLLFSIVAIPVYILTNSACCCCCQVASVASDSNSPHRQQPTRLPHPWDSPGKNTGVGCHFLLQCMKVKSLSHVWGFPFLLIVASTYLLSFW